MSYAAAAQHAPATSDPTPDPSLLESNQPANSTEHAEQVKHVKVASSTPTATQDSPSTVPRKRENEQSSSNASNGVAAGAGKKKKGKKGNKKAESSEEEKKGEDKKVEKKDKGEKVKDKESKPESKGKVEQHKKEEVKKSDDKKQQESKPDEEKKEEPKQDKQESEKSVSKTNNDEDESSQDEPKPVGRGFKTELESQPSMKDRPTAPKDLDKQLAEPHVARANIAATVESPNGTTENDYAEKHKDESVLQQHVGFFDGDNDGMIWPTDTFIGFHRLGYSLIWCILAVFLIHPTFSYFTLDSWIPDPFFRISVKKVHRAKHGSDTGVFDSQGRFIPAKFEALFAKFDKGKKGGLTFFEGLMMIRENRNILDPVGWIGAFFEWFASYLLIWPKNGVVTKEDLRTVYDGSLFYAVAEKESTVRSKQPWWAGFFNENRAGDVKRFKKIE